MAVLLLEIGCEELPAAYVASGEMQVREAIEAALVEARLDHGDVTAFATPRRLAVVVNGLAGAQHPHTSERRGPPVARGVAEDGSYTKAATGFAVSAGVAVDDLDRRTVDGGEYLFAVVAEDGAPAAEVLPEVIADALGSITFDKTMRWDPTGTRFPRPMRWLVALLDEDVISVRHATLEATRMSFGHRVSHPGPVAVESAGAYEATMREAGVIASRPERRRLVWEAAQAAAARLDGRAVLHDAIVDEVTDLVEHPMGLAGRFEPSYLEIPRAVLITAMESHQRYFAVEDGSGALMAGFVCVSNGSPSAADTIVGGNERVLRARLEDAAFFWREDLAVPLSERASGLGNLLFHAQLGSMRDKAARLEMLAPQVGEWMGHDAAAIAAAQSAARLCKADLLTQIVYEFPELEGEMGREYALRDRGLAEELGARLAATADAIAEHRQPRAADDVSPAGDAGAALSVADRLDTLVGYVGVGLTPTGAGDPFALRRQAGGLVQIVLERGSAIPVREAAATAWELYREQGRGLAPLAETAASVIAMLVGRIEPALLSEGIDAMLVRAAVGGPWTHLPDLVARARLLHREHAGGRLHRLAVAHERAYNLSRGAEGTEIDERASHEDADRRLLAVLVSVEADASRAAGVGDVLAALHPLVDELDDFLGTEHGVRVMSDDMVVRANRLAMLARAADLFARVADFSVVIPKELEGAGPTATADHR